MPEEKQTTNSGGRQQKKRSTPLPEEELAALPLGKLLTMLQEEALLQEDEPFIDEPLVAKIIFALAEKNYLTILQLVAKLLAEYFASGELKNYSHRELRVFLPWERSRHTEQLQQLKAMGVLGATPAENKAKEQLKGAEERTAGSSKYRLNLVGVQSMEEERPCRQQARNEFVQRIFEAYKQLLAEDSRAATATEEASSFSLLLQKQGALIEEQKLAQAIEANDKELAAIKEGCPFEALPPEAIASFISALCALFDDPGDEHKEALRYFLKKHALALLGVKKQPKELEKSAGRNF